MFVEWYAIRRSDVKETIGATILRPPKASLNCSAPTSFHHVRDISSMETLDGTEWDVVLADTGFIASLLALYVISNVTDRLPRLTNESPT